MLVLLRLALGWHFLYEGIWKIRHADQFVGETEGFLSAARGPMAGLFYGMLPDMDGHQRLEVNLSETDTKDADGKPLCKLAKSWGDLRQKFVDYYCPVGGKEDTNKLRDPLSEAAQKVYDRHIKGLNEFVKENGDKIKAHFESLKRYEEGVKTDPRTMFQRQRRWDEMQDLRKEAKGWAADLDSRENALKGELLDLLRKGRKSEVEAVALAAKKEAAAKAEAKGAAAETKKVEAAGTPAKLPADAAKPEVPKTKSAKEDKPSDPPKDMSSKPAKAKSKETAESGSEESGDAEESKAAAKETKSDAKAGAVVAAKPQVADEPKSAAALEVVVVDFSPLAVGRPENGPFARSSNILSWKRTEQLAFLLTWTLFAIGLCLMLGLFTRPAALMGAGFLLFVVMSQPSYNGVYPLDPPQLGHALLVNKDFVELIALLLIASTALGRWTGLDFFIHNYLVKPFCCKCGSCTTTEGPKA